jgi:AbrB family looped-hinge helix DNA binding protein
MPQSTSRVGKRGTVVIPAALRRRFGIEEGSLIIIAEDREEGILIRPAAAVPRKSTLRRGGRSFCSRAPWTKRTTRAPLARAKEEVRKMGLDPDTIPHRRRP